MSKKQVFIIAGPNGCGKTTFAKEFITEVNLPFLNADEIAAIKCPHNIEKARIWGGKIFINKIRDYIKKGKSFVIETTLSGKYLINYIKEFKKHNYKIMIIYIFIESAEEAIYRIDIRVRKGGHFVIEKDVRRRFIRSKNNFWNIYRKSVDGWEIFLNHKDEFLQVAFGCKEEVNIISEFGFSIFMEGVDN